MACRLMFSIVADLFYVRWEKSSLYNLGQLNANIGGILTGFSHVIYLKKKTSLVFKKASYSIRKRQYIVAGNVIFRLWVETKSSK